MNPAEWFHEKYVYRRRVQVLSGHLAALIPSHAKVLDIGCGDGLLAYAIMRIRPDVQIKGLDVLVREQSWIPVEPFDGRVIPYAERSWDIVMFVDVLHHTQDPMVLLREAARVAGTAIVIKDHPVDGFLARSTLRFMDRVGNVRHNVVVPFNYWPKRKWLSAFESLGLDLVQWTSKLSLYPAIMDWIFGRSLHFLAYLQVNLNPA